VSALAILLAALAVAMLIRASPGVTSSGARSLDLRSRRTLLMLPAAAGVVLVASVDGLRLVLALILVCAATAVAGLVSRSRGRKVADARQAKVVEVCEALAGELRAGQPLVGCLERCLTVWPEFEPVVAAGRLGADVGAAMRSLAALEGAGGLREVAAAWQVSEGSGSGLALALGQVAASARETQATRQLVRSELASAQATARLVALLPVAALAMSDGLGASPWHFLLGTPAGVAGLGVALVLAYAGLVWIDRIATAVLGQ
jgi:tight adherence protein B